MPESAEQIGELKKLLRQAVAERDRLCEEVETLRKVGRAEPAEGPPAEDGATPLGGGEQGRAIVEAIVTTVPTAIAYLDRELVFLRSNPAHCKLLGLPAEAIIGRKVSELPTEIEKATEADMQTVLSSGQSIHRSAMPFTRTGEGGAPRPTYWDFTFIPVLREEEVVGLIVVADDVSDRVDGERLQREKIEALRQADRLKDQFLGILSHELRTPINAITGFGSLLTDEIAGPLNKAQHEYLEKMLTGADTLLSLINDLLDMSRIQAGKFELFKDPMRFDAAVRHVVDSLAPLAGKKALEVRDEVPEDLPDVIADRQRVVQILTNLVGNAIKFTPVGGRVVVRARIEADHLRCEVEDTGIGIAPRHMAKLFNPFTQVDMSNTRQAGGTGLGLSICKALVEAHGGEIGVTSHVSGGSIFWFTLPLEGSPRPAGADAGSPGA